MNSLVTLLPSEAFSTVISALFVLFCGSKVTSYTGFVDDAEVKTCTLYFAFVPSMSPEYPVLNVILTFEPLSGEYALKVF